MTHNDSRFRQPIHFTSALTGQVHGFAELVLRTRFVEALRDGCAGYPIYRDLHFSAHVDLEMLFDDLATRPGWRAQRLGSGRMVLDADGLFVSAHGGRKAAYCSCLFNIWADSVVRAHDASEAILA